MCTYIGPISTFGVLLLLSVSFFAYMYLQDTEVGRLEGKLEEERSYTAKILDEVTIHNDVDCLAILPSIISQQNLSN